VGGAQGIPDIVQFRERLGHQLKDQSLHTFRQIGSSFHVKHRHCLELPENRSEAIPTTGIVTEPGNEKDIESQTDVWLHIIHPCIAIHRSIRFRIAKYPFLLKIDQEHRHCPRSELNRIGRFLIAGGEHHLIGGSVIEASPEQQPETAIKVLPQKLQGSADHENRVQFSRLTQGLMQTAQGFMPRTQTPYLQPLFLPFQILVRQALKPPSLS